MEPPPNKSIYPRLLLKFIGDGAPKLDSVEFKPSGKITMASTSFGAHADDHFRWDTVPRAVAVALLGFKIHHQLRPAKPFALLGRQKNNPVASIGDSYEKSPLLVFLRDKASIRFAGENINGKSKIEGTPRELIVQGMPPERVDILIGGHELDPQMQLGRLQDLLQKILRQEDGWLENWLAHPELAELAGKPVALPATPHLAEAPAAPQVSPEDRAIDARIRKVICADCEWIRLVGIREAANVNRLPLDISFIHLGFRPLGKKSSPEDKTLTLVEVLNHSRLCVIVGGPGSGKTTLTRMAAWQIARGKLTGQVEGLTSDTVPLLIKVRSLHKQFDRLPFHPAAIIEQCVPGKERPIVLDGFTKEYASRLFDSGRAVLIVDGLDECELSAGPSGKSPGAPLESEWGNLMQWLNSLCNHYPKVRIIVTSRPIQGGFGWLTAKMTEDTRFHEYQVLPLTPEQQPLLVRNWYAALETVQAAGAGHSQPQNTAPDKELLIKKLNDNENNIRNYCQTPLLLSVVCAVHYRGELDTARLSGLLHNLVDLLVDEWRSIHQTAEGFPLNILGTLNKAQLKNLLSGLALEMLRQDIYEADGAFLSKVFTHELDKIKTEHSGQPDLLTITAVNILELARDRSGILLESQRGIYTFAHNEFRDLLAGYAIARGHHLDELVANAGHTNWAWNLLQYTVESLSGSRETLLLALMQAGHLSRAADAAVKCGIVSERLQKIIIRAADLGVKHSLADCLYGLAKMSPYKEAVAKYFELLMRSSVVFTTIQTWRKVSPSFFQEHSGLFDIDALVSTNIQRCLKANYSTIYWDDKEESLPIMRAHLEKGGQYQPASLIRLSFLANAPAEYRINLLPWLCLSLSLADNQYYYGAKSELGKGLNAMGSTVSLGGVVGEHMEHFLPHWEAYVSGFKLYLERFCRDLPEHGLLAFLFFLNDTLGRPRRAEYTTVLDQMNPAKISDVLALFENFPPGTAPAIQIGMVNCLVYNFHTIMSGPQRVQALAIWQRCTGAVGEGLVQFVEARHEHFGILKNGALEPATKEELSARVRDSFARELSQYEPFSFEITGQEINTES